MKYIIIISLFLVSCNSQNEVKEENKYFERTEGDYANSIKSIEFEGCEYICFYSTSYNGGRCIIHKQNCKYCKKDTL